MKLTDFGVSRQFDQETGKADTCSVVGTPYWMAPEVIFGLKYSYPADIWSVGATVVEMLEGLPPYGEEPVMRAIVRIGNSGWNGWRKSSRPSRELDDFVRRCMVREVDQRATIKQLLTHPFVARAVTLDRHAVLEPLLSKEIDFQELLKAPDSGGQKKGSEPEPEPQPEPEPEPQPEAATVRTKVVTFPDLEPEPKDSRPGDGELAALDRKEDKKKDHEGRVVGFIRSLDPGHETALLEGFGAFLFVVCWLLIKSLGGVGLGSLVAVVVVFSYLVSEHFLK
jgi:serine/threonine protein kinase